MGSVLGARGRSSTRCLPLLLLLALLVVPPPAAAIEPPPEVAYVCVDPQDNVDYVEGPADCGGRDTLRRLPGDGPVYWCADHLGRLDEAAGKGACSSREQALTVPDDGVIFVCAGNIRGGTTEPRGALRTVSDLSDCDPDETGLVTPAAPEGVADSYAIDEDTLLVVPDKGVLDNDLDLTGAPLTAHLVSPPSRGTLALAPAGGFSYDPRAVFDSLDAGESASTTFTYLADDGALISGPTTVTITVTGRNDRPVAADDVFTTDEDTVVQVVPPGVLGNDEDAEGHPLTSAVVDGPPLGDLTLADDGALRFDPGGDFQHLGAAPGDDDTVTFTYVARDGSTASDTATVRVEVRGVNDAPVGAADTFTTDENTALEISPDQLLGNDTDAEGQALSVTDVVLPGNGSGVFDVQPDGSITFDPAADSGDPDSAADFDHLAEGQQAIVELTYRADDGGLASSPVTVTVVVRGLSAPTANDDVRTTGEDSAIAIDLFDNDEVRGGLLTLDPSGAGGSVVVETEGVVRYDPSGAFDQLAAGATDTDTFRYTLTNGEGSSTGTVTLAITGTNDAPVASDDTYQVQPGTALVVHGEDSHDLASCTTDPCDVLANDTDVDTLHQGLLALLVSPPDRGRLSLMPDGGFSFDPAGEFGDTGGQTTFTYRADDGSDQSATATVTFVVSTNQPPAFGSESYEKTILAAASPGSEVVDATATDADGDPLLYTLLDPDTTAFDLDPATGAITVGSGGAPAVGTYGLTVAVSDGRGGTDTATVTIHVVPELNAVDDAYVAVGNTELVGGSPAPGSFAERAAVHVGSLLANDGGTTGTVIPESGVATTGGGSVDIASDGSFVYTPPPADPAATGATAWDGQAPLEDTFAYHLVEGDDVADATGAVTITVLDAVWYVDNDVSTAGSGTAWDPYGALAAVSGEGTATDPDKDLPGQTVFLLGHPDDSTTDGADESAYPGGIELEAGQSLVGQGSGLSVAGPAGDITVVLAGATPVVTAPTGSAAVTLASANHLRGFTVGGAGDGIVGTAPGSLVAELTSVVTNGDPLRLVAGTTADRVDVRIGLVGSSDTTGGLVLDGLRGTVLLGEADLVHGGGVTVDAAPAILDPVDGDVLEPAGIVRITDADIGAGAFSVPGNGGEITVGGLVGSGGRIDVDGNTGAVGLGVVHLTGVTGTGIEISDENGTTTVGDGEVTGDSESLVGSLLAVTGVSDSTAGTIHVGADLLLEPADLLPTVHSGRSVDIAGVDGTVEVSGAVVDRGLGIRISDAPGTVRFTGGLDVLTGPTSALYAESVGTLEVPAGLTDVELAGGAAPALHLQDVGIGGAGMVLDRVDSAGAVGSGVILHGVTADPAPGEAGLTVLAGTIATPAVSGVAVVDSSGVTLRGLLVDESAGDGIVIEQSEALTAGGTGVTVDGVQVRQADLVGIDVTGSGDVLIDGTTVSSSGSNGIRLTDLRGTTTLRGSTVDSSRDVQLLVDDGTASTPQQDAVVLDSTVLNGGEPEDDSIRVAVYDAQADGVAAADLEFRVAGSTPSGSIGGDIGLYATATGGSRLHLALSRFAIAATAGDGVRLQATGAGTAATFEMSTMNTDGGGGIQLTGGAGVRVTGDGLASVGGTLNDVSVVSTGDSGIVLDQVSGVGLDVVGVRATGGHGVEVVESSEVTMDQLEVVSPAQHGVRVFGGTDVVLDDSRVDMLPPPPAAKDEPSTYDDFSAVWMRHLGGTANAVTDTTLRGSTGDQLKVLEGTTMEALPGDDAAPPPGAPTSAELRLSGLTVIETGVDPLPDDTVVTEANAVTVVAGSGAILGVDLTGAATRVDETMALRAEGGGTLGITGGHAVEHDGADSERDGADDSIRLAALGSGPDGPSTLELGLRGLSVDQVAPDDLSDAMPGSALVVAASAGGQVVPAPGAASIGPAVTAPSTTTPSSVVSVGAANAVQLLSDGSGSSLDFSASGLDVRLVVPTGYASSADAVSVTGRDSGEVAAFSLTGGNVAAHGGEAIDLQAHEVIIDMPLPLVDVVLPAGSIASATIDGVAVTGGAGDAIEATGNVGDVAVLGATVSAGGGHGIHVSDLEAGNRKITVSATTVAGNAGDGMSISGPACLVLDHNVAIAVGDVGYVLLGVALAGFRDGDHPVETVEAWLGRFDNKGPPSPDYENHSPEVPGSCAR